jgi:hypothetical protein
VNYPTPELMREMANDVPDEERTICLAAADALEQRGFYATPQMFLITEAKALEVELRGLAHAAEHVVPGWRCYFEGKVRVNEAGTDLDPITAVESTENVYATHKAAVADSMHAMKQARLTPQRLTRTQKRQPVYILPSYLGVATDRHGKVISR